MLNFCYFVNFRVCSRLIFRRLFSHRLIKFRQSARRKTDPIQALKNRPFRKSPSERAVFKAARAGRDRQIDVDESTLFLQAFDQIQIFKQRQRFKAFDFIVSFAANEDRRIAVNQPPVRKVG
jgi:hypothetical protein